MSSLRARIGSLYPTIIKIIEVSGGAGVSIGIIHGDETITAGHGFRDIEHQLSPNDNSIYHLASLSKSFSAAAVGILLHENKLRLDQKVHDIIPGYHHPDPRVQNEATVLDFLSHRIGLATKNSLWQQDGPELLLEQADILPIVSSLEVVAPLGSKWTYSNWGYEVIADIISHASGMSWAAFLQTRIFEPLGLNNTFTCPSPPSDNWAQGYMAALDGSSTNVGRPLIAEGTVMKAAAGIKSTITDLLIYYKALLESYQQESAASEDTKSPFKNLTKTMFTPHVALDLESHYEQGYGAGWVVAELPAPVGTIGTNEMFVDEMPVVGRGGDKRRLWYHNGSLVGFFSSVHVLPDSGTIIVVLMNSLAKNDCADWLGQLLLQELLDAPEKNDYLLLATKSAASYERQWQELQQHYEADKSPGLLSRPLADYTGKYYNEIGNWFIEVILGADGQLHFMFQGRKSQSHRLEEYGKDVLGWLMTEAESRTAGRWPDLDVSTYLFHYQIDEADGNVHSLRWEHDPDVPGGETFVKQRTPRYAQHIISYGSY